MEASKEQRRRQEENQKASLVRGKKEKEEREVPDQWTLEQTQILVKAVNLFPAGTASRGCVIADYINAHTKGGKTLKPKHVIKKVKTLPKSDASLEDECNRNANLDTSLSQTKSPGESVPTVKYDVDSKEKAPVGKTWRPNEQRGPDTSKLGNDTTLSQDNIAQDPYLLESPKQVEAQPQNNEQVQVKQQLYRSIQASTQMLYDIFDYSIGMIEELEKHEKHGKKVQNSGIFNHLFPAGHKKPKNEVIPGIELELICLEAQMKSLPEEVTSNAKKGLVMETLKWAASREAAEVPYGDVDKYCRNVLEILVFQAPIELPKREPTPMIKLTAEEVNQAMSHMAKERHKGEKQDEEFHKDDKKKAKRRPKRQDDSIRDGARRLKVLEDANLAEVLEAAPYNIPDLKTDTT